LGHEAALRKITAWASAEDSVRGLVLLGSRARLDVPADEWSDADVPVLLSADDALATLAGGHQVLLDKDGLFDDLPERLAAFDPGPAATGWPPPAAEVVELTNNFWHHCMWITKRLRRGELFRAHGALVGYQRGILLRFVEWQALTRSDGRAQTWYDGRFLEQWAAPETVTALAEVFPPYTADGVAAALISAMRTFRDVAGEVAAAVGADYPAEADRWVTEWVTRILAERA